MVFQGSLCLKSDPIRFKDTRQDVANILSCLICSGVRTAVEQQNLPEAGKLSCIYKYYMQKLVNLKTKTFLSVQLFFIRVKSGFSTLSCRYENDDFELV